MFDDQGLQGPGSSLQISVTTAQAGQKPWLMGRPGCWPERLSLRMASPATGLVLWPEKQA